MHAGQPLWGGAKQLLAVHGQQREQCGGLKIQRVINSLHWRPSPMLLSARGSTIMPFLPAMPPSSSESWAVSVCPSETLATHTAAQYASSAVDSYSIYRLVYQLEVVQVLQVLQLTRCPAPKRAQSTSNRQRQRQVAIWQATQPHCGTLFFHQQPAYRSCWVW